MSHAIVGEFYFFNDGFGGLPQSAAMSINCLGMRDEKLGRFTAPLLAPLQRADKFFKEVCKKKK